MLSDVGLPTALAPDDSTVSKYRGTFGDNNPAMFVMDEGATAWTEACAPARCRWSNAPHRKRYSSSPLATRVSRSSIAPGLLMSLPKVSMVRSGCQTAMRNRMCSASALLPVTSI